MSSDGRYVPLGDLGVLDRGRSRHRPRYAPHLYGGTYPFIQTGDIKSSGGKITTYSQTYSEEGLAQSRLWDTGTLCITIAANIAETAVLTFPACFPDSVVGFLPDESKVDVRYVEYAIRYLREGIQSSATGSVQDNINLEYLRKLEIPLSPLPEQKAIVHILGTLDDKIELNRKTNETLEAIAKALFKSWFVDFNPVRAKAEGRPTGLPAEISDLFPDSFEGSVLGEIPRGWNIRPITELIEVDPSRKLTKGSRSPYLEMKGMPTSGHWAEGVFLRNFTSGSKFSNGDTLFARITPCLENGKTAFVDFLDEGEVGWGSTEFIVLSGREGISGEFVYYLARTEEFRNHAIQNMSGSSGRQRVPAECVWSFLFPAPPRKVIDHFCDLVKPTVKSVQCNHSEATILASLRDALLPKLIRN